MSNYVQVGTLKVNQQLFDFINEQALPNTEVPRETYWEQFELVVNELAPKNKQLLKHRDALQQQIDSWHKEHPQFEFESYKTFLTELGYIEPKPEPFTVTTENIDDEIALQAGPQLVVPASNARYAINAANARWGSLYDALYGTNAISDEDGAGAGKGYNPKRGEKVIAFAKAFLNKAASLVAGQYEDVTSFQVENGQLIITLANGAKTSLHDREKFVGYKGLPEAPKAILLKNNDLHIEIQIDHTHPVGATDNAGIKDIWLESAVTTIIDFEDSVAAVDAEDKVQVYTNWLGLIKGDLTASFQKGERVIERTLNPDRQYVTASGETITLHGRSLLFVRNVGHLMTNPAVLYNETEEIPEGILDALVTVLISKHDVLKNGRYQNSRKGSIYIVKPKMHGSQEVAFANELFTRAEQAVNLPTNTLKIGVMDEERRTSLNLAACIHAVKERIVFINTGFLDRTGDEIHTSMEAGVMVRKGDMKHTTWLQAYEKSNVEVGLQTGLPGKAQIGKGMWAMPDLMAEMLEQKINHPKAGATTAWVPSPTAATLHATHYHDVHVRALQQTLKISGDAVDAILQIPLASVTNWSAEEIQQELDNNAQGILGYVVRWVEHGVGCSKVPDINNIGLMEDRATLRISSQHVANWLRHGICSAEQVEETLRRMAVIVDEQNADDPDYTPMAANFDESIAFQAAHALVFDAYAQPNGYTEPILHQKRLQLKAKQRVQA